MVATELVTTSISSGGDGLVSRADITEVLAENPHLRYHNSRRGYVRTRITPDELRVDFRVGAVRLRPRRPGPHRGVIRRARWRAGAALDVSP